MRDFRVPYLANLKSNHNPLHLESPLRMPVTQALLLRFLEPKDQLGMLPLYQPAVFRAAFRSCFWLYLYAIRIPARGS